MGELFTRMLEFFLANYKVGKKSEIVNLGGSRSGKTYEAAHLLLFFADKYKVSTEIIGGVSRSILDGSGKESLIIDVYRKQLKDVKKTFADFCACIQLLNASGFKVSSSNSDSPSITAPNGNIITFNRLPDDNKPIEAGKSHIIYFNEALEIPSRKVISNAVMRCELLVIYDSNPSLTSHWLFDKVEMDKTILATHTTYRNNKHLPRSIIDGIEQSCPWDLKDYKEVKQGVWQWRVAEDLRKPNHFNIANKTADKRLWLIYGEGVRSAREGSAFPHLTWINMFPDISFDTILYGLDFGWTNDETSLVKVGISGKDIYVCLLYYKQCPKSDLLYAEIEAILKHEEKMYSVKGIPFELNVVCESQDNRNGDQFVSSLAHSRDVNNHLNWHFFKVKKPRYRSMSVDLVNMYNLFVVKSPQTETEFLNFVFEERNGEITSILHGTKGRNNHDHAIDAMLYACWEALKHKVI